MVVAMPGGWVVRQVAVTAFPEVPRLACGIARNASAGDSPCMVEISLLRLTLALIPLLAVGWIWYRWTGGSKELVMATARMVVQLLGVGYVLVLLFKVENPWVGVGVVGFMIAVSSWIAIRTVKKLRMRAYLDAFLAIGLGGGVVFLLVVLGVLALEPWYQPRYVIPLAGMTYRG